VKAASVFCGLCLLLLLPASGSQAEERGGAASPLPQDDRPKVGLVLGGGAARGGAHIGVLRVLEELRVPVDYIAGSSIGAVIGGLYAAGLAPDQMSAEIAAIDWLALFDDRPGRSQLSFRRKEDTWQNYFPFEIGFSSAGVRSPAGFVSGRKLDLMLQSLTLHTSDVAHFDDLPIPYRAIATDFETGGPVALDRGSLARAIRASMSIPGAFTPVPWNGRWLVDGSMSNNLPVELVREMGADVIIVVDVSPHLAEGDFDQLSLLDVGVQTIYVMMAGNTALSLQTLEEDDVLLMPDLQDIELLEFNEMNDAEGPGEAAARGAAPALEHLSLSPEAYARYLAGQRRQLVSEDTGFRIDSLTIRGGDRVPENQLRRRIAIAPGDTLNLAELQEDLLRVVQIGEYDHVGYALDRTGPATHLQISAHEKPWGPNYLLFGLNLKAVLDGWTDFGLLFYHRRAYVNRLGGEWLNRLNIGDQIFIDSELFQPLTPTGVIFVAPRLQFRDEILNYVSGAGGQVAYDMQLGIGQLDLGAQWSNLMQLRLGARWGKRRIKLRAAPDQRDSDDIGEWRLHLGLDVLDQVGFPRSGGELLIDGRLSRESLGATVPYSRLWARGAIAGSWRRSALLLAGEFGTSFDSELPFYEQFELGGFTRMSGWNTGARYGNALGLASLVAYREMLRLPEVLGRGLYLGASGELGQVWPSPDEARLGDLTLGGSIFLGLDSNLGPLYTVFGMVEGGDTAISIILGPVLSAYRLP
jgi:NTE family protein